MARDLSLVVADEWRASRASLREARRDTRPVPAVHKTWSRVPSWSCHCRRRRRCGRRRASDSTGDVHGGANVLILDRHRCRRWRRLVVCRVVSVHAGIKARGASILIELLLFLLLLLLIIFVVHCMRFAGWFGGANVVVVRCGIQRLETFQVFQIANSTHSHFCQISRAT